MTREQVLEIQVQSTIIEREGIKNADLETGYAAANAVAMSLIENDLILAKALDDLDLDLFGKGRLLYDYLVAVQHKGRKAIEHERIQQLEVVAGVCRLLKPYFVEEASGSGIISGRIRGRSKKSKGPWHDEGYTGRD